MLAALYLGIVPTAASQPRIGTEASPAQIDGQSGARNRTAAPREETADRDKDYIGWLMEDRQRPDGKAAGSMARALVHAAHTRIPAAAAGATWQPIGPAPLGTLDQQAAWGGRTNSIAIDPRDPDVLYLGAALGGVWKSTDGGASWTPLTDDQPSLASGAIALAPSNPDRVYVGTGEENFSGDSLYGAGVLRSDDGGISWAQLGADVFVDPNGGGARTSRIVVDPNNPDLVYLATTWGLWKSNDGGQSWDLKLSDRTQAAITDLLMSPNDAATLYAAVSVPNGAANKGLYRSVDFGETWAPLDLGLDLSQIGRVNIALAPSNPQIMYAAVGNAAGSAPQMFRLKSIDGGESWERLPDCNSGCNQQSYNNIIRVHPEDPDIVYQGAVQLFRTLDGGLTWTQTTRSHPDHHWLVFDQLNRLYIGEDGGIFRINSDDTTSDLNNLQTNLFYPGISLHPTNPSFVLGGMQDTSSGEFTGSLDWRRICGGDGSYTAIEGADGDPDNVFYCSSQNLAINQTTDGGLSFHSARNGLSTTGAAFIAPFIIDPNNSHVLITGTRGIWRTEDAAGSWQRNSPEDLSANAAFRALAFAPACSDTTYYAGSTGRIWRTTDTGQTWTEVTQRDTPAFPNTVVTHIAVSARECNTVWATFSGFRDDGRHVFMSTDGGDTWADISGNLPNLPTNAFLADETGDLPVLYVGTDLGVFRSVDGTTWENFNVGLPNVRVEDLVMNPATGVLVASTHGRGMWQLIQQ